MLAKTARLAGLIAGALDPIYLRRSARLTRTMLVAYAVVGVMALIALLFAFVAVFAGLANVMPPWAAALVIAAVAVLLGGLAMLIAKRASRGLMLPPPRPMPGLALDPTAAAASTLSPLLDEVLTTTQRRPGETFLLAIAAGVIAGRLLQAPRK